MNCMDFDLFSSFLSLPDGIVIGSVHPTENSLIVQVTCSHAIATCPLCQQPSKRVHGDYVRTVADLPCGGRRVILSLTVRKFVCGTSACCVRFLPNGFLIWFSPMPA
jgi:hypothetical protein